jgi:hypothetical protein
MYYSICSVPLFPARVMLEPYIPIPILGLEISSSNSLVVHLPGLPALFLNLLDRTILSFLPTYIMGRLAFHVQHSIQRAIKSIT